MTRTLPAPRHSRPPTTYRPGSAHTPTIKETIAIDTILARHVRGGSGSADMVWWFMYICVCVWVCQPPPRPPSPDITVTRRPLPEAFDPGTVHITHRAAHLSKLTRGWCPHFVLASRLGRPCHGMIPSDAHADLMDVIPPPSTSRPAERSDACAVCVLCSQAVAHLLRLPQHQPRGAAAGARRVGRQRSEAPSPHD